MQPGSPKGAQPATATNKGARTGRNGPTVGLPVRVAGMSVFAPAEKAALAWAEAVTRVAETGTPQALNDALFVHYSEQKIVDLTLIIAQMNAWNRLAISFGHVPNMRAD